MWRKVRKGSRRSRIGPRIVEEVQVWKDEGRLEGSRRGPLYVHVEVLRRVMGVRSLELLDEMVEAGEIGEDGEGYDMNA